MNFNHHSASVLPFHLDLEGKLHFVMEQKDSGYKAPFFDNGLNFLGGNWEKGIHSDKSPVETVDREINEEFWEKYEAPESLNALLGQEFLAREPQVAALYGASDVQRIKQVVPLFLSGMKHAGDYAVTVNPPITKTPLIYGSTIFVKSLSADELKNIEQILKEFDGKLTTDNLKWGSRIVSVSLADINQKGRKFSWGYCSVVNALLANGYLPKQPNGVLRPLSLIGVSPLNCPPEVERTEAGCPTYAGFEKAGCSYSEKKK